jgi:hypothetical protein
MIAHACTASLTHPPARQAPVLPSVAFVACLEAGPMETQVRWLLESLRRWGGTLAEAEFFAVTPRRGLPLADDTERALDRLRARTLRFPAPHAYGWWGPMNKPAALAAAEQETDADVIVWLDSDTLVLGEPLEVALEAGIDFAAHPASRVLDIGTDGEDGHEAYWRTVLAAHGIHPDRYSWIPGSRQEGGRMRMYWQSGVFAYRRATRLGRIMLDRSVRQMEARIASRDSGIYFHEQTALGIAVHAERLRHAILGENHNRPLNKLVPAGENDWPVAETRILHYFGSAWPDAFPWMVSSLEAGRPDVAAWLREQGPLRDGSARWQRILARLWRQQRSAAARRFSRTCAVS